MTKIIETHTGIFNKDGEFIITPTEKINETKIYKN